jgi:hypothetical protein
LLASGIRPADAFSIGDKAKDVWAKEFKSKTWTAEKVATMKRHVREGIKAQDVLIQYNDFLLTTTHPQPPADANAVQRDNATIFNPSNGIAHPCSKDARETMVNASDEKEEQYCNVLNAVERHKCSNYCLRIKSRGAMECRGGFPHELRGKTIVRVLQKKKQSKDGRKEINSSIELLTKRNDCWLNSHSRPFMDVWNANIDFRLTIDVGKIISYMTKYVTKTEACHTPRTRRLLFSCLSRVSQDGSDTAVILKRLMTKVHGERVRSKQETCHLMNSLPLIHCSHLCKKVDLRNASKQIEVAIDDDDGQSAQVTCRKTVIDAYAVRMDASNWLFQEEYVTAVENDLVSWNLNTFAARLCVGVNGTHRHRIKPHPNPKTIIVFNPNLPNNKSNETYSKYCKLSLV